MVPGTMLFAMFGAGAAVIAWILFSPQSKRNDRRWAEPTHSTRARLCSPPVPPTHAHAQARVTPRSADSNRGPAGVLASLPNA